MPGIDTLRGRPFLHTNPDGDHDDDGDYNDNNNDDDDGDNSLWESFWIYLEILLSFVSFTFDNTNT